MSLGTLEAALESAWLEVVKEDGEVVAGRL